MKNKNLWLTILSVALICCLAVAVTACKATDFTIQFIVDDVDYAILSTSGQEVIRMPQNPAKDGYTFDGWYWDVGTWQRPFTANSLLNEPLTSNMSVYAKFTEIHNHILTLQPAVKADCEHVGNEAYYTCTCGKMFADAQATVELTAVPTINKTEHTPTDWIVDSKATCTENGSKHIECSVCHATLQTESIPSNGHTPETEWIIDKTAMCTVDGSKHLECSVCHATLQTDVIPATGHSYSNEWSKDEHGHWRVAACEHSAETTAIEPHTYDSNYKCKICSYQDTSLHGTEIATDVFTVDGETLYAKVPNAQTTFSFINAIQVADSATFVVATDLAASNVIRTKTVSLEIGDNTYYILVENGNDIQLYTVTLRRRPIYTVAFVTNGGTACESQQVEEDSLATEPTTTKTGYTFTSWNYNFATPVTQNTTITASWTANKYTVTYDVNGGVLTDTQFTVTYDSAYTLAVPTREGHTFQGWYIDDTQITNTNGQSRTNWTYLENKTITAKWTINSYTLTITNPNSNAGTVTGDGTYVYDSEVTVTASEPNLGYEWLGWYDGEELLTTELTYNLNMPTNDLKFTANYELRSEMSNFNFTSTNASCIIRGLKDKYVTEIIVPNYVTSIGKGAFQNCNKLEKITIPFVGTSKDGTNNTHFGYIFGEIYYNNSSSVPSSLKTVVITGGNTIAENAFSECSNITSVTIPESVTSISMQAFYGCSSLTSIIIPTSVTSIGSNAFGNCSKLANINYLGTIESWCTGNIQELYYLMEYGIGNKTLSINGEPVTELVIPSTVTSIPSYAFSNTNIKSVTFEENSQCTSIGDRAFYGCSLLTSVTMPDSITSIGYWAFNGCSKLTNINYLGTIESWCNVQSLDGLMRYGTSSKTFSINGEQVIELVIPSTITSIPSHAFSNTNITSVTIPDGVTRIGNRAFDDCSKLANINYLGTIESWCKIEGLDNLMEVSAKVFCINGEPITELVISDTLTTIPSYAFYGCINITSVIIPNSVTSIGKCAVYSLIIYCKAASKPYSWESNWNSYRPVVWDCDNNNKDVDGYEYAIIDGVRYALKDNVATVTRQLYNVTEADIPLSFNYKDVDYSVTSIGENAFYMCSSLTSITIPQSITDISFGAFGRCSSLATVNIPKSVTYISQFAFQSCSNLETINFAGTISQWNAITKSDDSWKEGVPATTIICSDGEVVI